MYKTLYTYAIRIDNNAKKPPLSGRKYKASSVEEVLVKHLHGVSLTRTGERQFNGIRQEVWIDGLQNRYVITELKKEVVKC